MKHNYSFITNVTFFSTKIISIFAIILYIKYKMYFIFLYLKIITNFFIYGKCLNHLNTILTIYSYII